jgi:hypothetical protein
MPPWLIEWFGGPQLEDAFFWITVLPLPCWFLLLFGQGKSWGRRLGHPLVLPLFPVPLWGYVAFKMAAYLTTDDFGGGGFFGARETLAHPLIFLVVWAQLQVVNLFVATVIFREGQRAGVRVTPEIVLAWMFAPLALAVCAVRVASKRTFFR